MGSIIEFKNVCKSYENNNIIDNLNLEIENGEFVTIIGTSGSGKTTLLKMVNGLVEFDSGEIIIENESIKDKNLIELRRNIGYAIQGSVLFPHMTVEKNIAYVPNLVFKKDKKAISLAVDKWLDAVQLDRELKNRYPNELSGGQQQRVGIARALAVSPKILLMDEPFGAVDEITREKLQNILKEIHKKTGTTILFVTHSISEALDLATKVVVMDKGEVVQYASPSEILENPATHFVESLIKNIVEKIDKKNN